MRGQSAWRVVYSEEFIRSTKKLDRQTRTRLVRALEAVAQTGQPRSRGKALTGPYTGLWRYRVGDWRIVTELADTELTILVLRAGHRSTIY